MAWAPVPDAVAADVVFGNPGDTWAVDGAGHAWHWDGDTWNEIDLPISTLPVTGGFVLDSDNTWVCGPVGSIDGSIFFYNGSGWALSYNGIRSPYEIWAAAPDDVWAAADTKFLHFDGTSWSETTVPGGGEVDTIWGFASNDIYAGGTGGGIPALLHWDGSTWSYVDISVFSGAMTIVRSVRGSDSGNIWIVGDAQMVGHSNGGVTWVQLTPPVALDFTAVAPRAIDDVWLVGNFPFYAHVSDQSTIVVVSEDEGYTYAAPTRPNSKSIVAAAVDDAFAGGGNAGGKVYHWDGPGGPAPLPPSPPSPTVQVNDYPNALTSGSDDIFGQDFKSVPDMTFSPINGSRVVAEALYRRLTTARGLLLFHPDYGLDLRGMLSDGISTEGLSALKSSLEREAEKDERVFSVSVGLSYDQPTEKLSASFAITTAAGPFQFVIAVSKVTTQLLFQGA